MDHHLSQENSNLENPIVQAVLENGQDGILEAVRVLLNQAMFIERSNALNAAPYERTEERLGQANGYKSRGLDTRLGKITLAVPQARGVAFYPTCLEKGMRSERALHAVMAEMYVHGIATRKVRKVLQSMCGLDVSASQVSRATALLDGELQKWRTRPLGFVSHLILDARYEKVRVDRCARDCALLAAYGVDRAGRKTVLGLSASLSEAEEHWKDFLRSLVARGLCGVETLTSDDHKGLGAARKDVFSHVPWQRCQFHLQQNAASYVPKKDMQEEVHEDIRAVFNAPNGKEAEAMLLKTVEKYAEKAPELAEWMEQNIPEGLTVFSLPVHKRKKLRTTNLAEYQNKELKRRTRLISVFPNKESLLRIASALLMEQDEEWQAAEKAYMRM